MTGFCKKKHAESQDPKKRQKIESSPILSQHFNSPYAGQATSLNAEDSHIQPSTSKSLNEEQQSTKPEVFEIISNKPGKWPENLNMAQRDHLIEHNSVQVREHDFPRQENFLIPTTQDFFQTVRC